MLIELESQKGQNWMAAVAEHDLYVSYSLGMHLNTPTALWILGEMTTFPLLPAKGKAANGAFHGGTASSESRSEQESLHRPQHYNTQPSEHQVFEAVERSLSCCASVQIRYKPTMEELVQKRWRLLFCLFLFFVVVFAQ